MKVGQMLVVKFKMRSRPLTERCRAPESEYAIKRNDCSDRFDDSDKGQNKALGFRNEKLGMFHI